MNEEEIKYVFSSVVIGHYLEPCSRISDYDYDPNNMDKRFISYFMHHLNIYDKFTGIPQIKLSFVSEDCANIITILYDILSRMEIEHIPLSVVIRNIFVEGSGFPSMLVINRESSSHISCGIEDVMFLLSQEDILLLAEILSNDEAINMQYLEDPCYADYYMF